MPPEGITNAPGFPSTREDTIGLHSDFWTRFLLWLLRVFPAWFCVLMTPPIAIVFYALAARQRTALIANLGALKPELSPFALWWAGHRVFVQFALTYMDRLWSLHLGHPLRWEIQNREDLEQQLATPEGVLIFTTHSGNYDIGAALFARHFPRPIHIVRVPEKTKALQEFRAAELVKVEYQNPHLRIHYSTNEWNLGLELCRLLQAGAVVAVQGDRILSATPPVVLEHNGATFHLPRGPLVLAEVCRVPCYGVFLSRLGRCHYRLQTGRSFYDGKTRRQAQEIGQAWLSVMSAFVTHHWDQWFIFEKLVTRPKRPAPGEGPSPMPPAETTRMQPCE